MEDHYPEGGLGDAVLASLATVRNTVVKKLAVNNVPRSGNRKQSEDANGGCKTSTVLVLCANSSVHLESFLKSNL